MSFQDNLRMYRERLGINAKDFAAQLGIKYTTYAGYENQGKEPKYETLCKIAAALHVSIDELMGYKPDKLQYWVDNFPIPEADISVSNSVVNITIENQSSGKWSIIIPSEDFVHFMDEIAKKAHAETDDLYQRALSLATREFIMQIADYEKEK